MELISQPLVKSGFKTSLCSYFTKSGFCKYSDSCSFAHTRDELHEFRRIQEEQLEQPISPQQSDSFGGYFLALLGYDWQRKGDQIYDPRLEAKGICDKLMLIIFRFQVQRASLTQKCGEVQQDKLRSVKKMLVPEFSRFGFRFEDYTGGRLDSQEMLFNVFSGFFKFIMALEEQLLIKL